jgi:hypothetical protein
MTRILRLSTDVQAFYDCAPCFENDSRETKAVVLVVDPSNTGNDLSLTAMCGNHAEGVNSPEIDPREVQIVPIHKTF